jgi:hypothetical protein
VVEVLGRGSAVLTTVAIPRENGAPVQRDAGSKGNSHVMGESHHRRLREHAALRTELTLSREE